MPPCNRDGAGVRGSPEAVFAATPASLVKIRYRNTVDDLMTLHLVLEQWSPELRRAERNRRLGASAAVFGVLVFFGHLATDLAPAVYLGAGIVCAVALLVHDAVRPSTLVLAVAIALLYWLGYSVNDFFDAAHDSTEPSKARWNFFVQHPVGPGPKLGAEG